MKNSVKLKGKPQIRKMVMEAIIPDYVGVYCDSSGLMVIDKNGKHHIVISSDKYKSPMWAFDQFCRALDFKVGVGK